LHAVAPESARAERRDNGAVDAARHPDDGSTTAQLLPDLLADCLLDARAGRCGVKLESVS